MVEHSLVEAAPPLFNVAWQSVQSVGVSFHCQANMVKPTEDMQRDSSVCEGVFRLYEHIILVLRMHPVDCGEKHG